MKKDSLTTSYLERAYDCLKSLTIDIRDRSVGSAGNRDATAYFEAQLRAEGWPTETQGFDAVDWHGAGATLAAEGGTAFSVFPSPYSLGCRAFARLEAVSTVEELEMADASGALLLLHGEIVREPLMPKSFPFFRVDEQQRIIGLLEGSGAAAIICASPSNDNAAEETCPEPMIADGDFTIPSVVVTQAEGQRLLRFAGQYLTLISESRRIPSRAANIIGRMHENAPRRMVITAHIDARKNVPGALDNATGITTLLLLSKLLVGYKGDLGIELVALNGEDHYAVPGQMAYLAARRDVFEEISLNINIDGVGYSHGETAFSFFGLPAGMKEHAVAELLGPPDTCEGIPWPQGDHSMFVQSGCPAIAVTSNWLLQNMSTQRITHTSRDSIDRVDPGKLVSCAQSIKRYIEAIS